jgi:DNA repair protein RadC
VREHVPDWDAASFPTILERPAAVARWLGLKLAPEPQECFGSLHLDTRYRLIEHVEHFRGGYDRDVIDPSPVFASALLSGCAGLVLYHNHPSGDPNPSAEDLAVTKRIDDGCKLLGLRLADHLIIGTRGRYCSLQERGGW